MSEKLDSKLTFVLNSIQKLSKRFLKQTFKNETGSKPGHFQFLTLSSTAFIDSGKNWKRPCLVPDTFSFIILHETFSLEERWD